MIKFLSLHLCKVEELYKILRVGYTAPFSQSIAYFRPRHAIFHTLFLARCIKSIPFPVLTLVKLTQKWIKPAILLKFVEWYYTV